jgi:DNA-binding transcriptional ArsR family regulator
MKTASRSLNSAWWSARARVMKALGHPTRLFLVDTLAGGERCVCELTALVGADISTVSKHLATLRAAGLVADERRGNQVFYRLRLPCAAAFFRCLEAVLQADAAAAGVACTTPVAAIHGEGGRP